MTKYKEDDKLCCSVCDKTFKLKSSYRIHMKKHSGQRYQCNQCDKSYTASHSLVEHKRCHENIKPYSCKTCGKHFQRRTHFLRHKKQHEKGTEMAEKKPRKPVSTSSDGLVISSKVDSQKNQNKPVIVCKICSKIFSNGNSFRVHKNKHLGIKYPCPICGRCFTTKDQVTLHAAVHSEVKNYGCDECDMKFKTKPNLTRHKKTHLGIKKYVCHQCGKAFVLNESLSAHMKVHNASVSIPCDICGAQFKTKPGLAIHKKIHNNQKDFLCGICSRTFLRKKTLDDHLKVHEKGTQRKALVSAPVEFCSLCSKGFADSYGLRRHMRKHKLGILKNFNKTSAEIQTDTIVDVNSISQTQCLDKSEHPRKVPEVFVTEGEPLFEKIYAGCFENTDTENNQQCLNVLNENIRIEHDAKFVINKDLKFLSYNINGENSNMKSSKNSQIELDTVLANNKPVITTNLGFYSDCHGENSHIINKNTCKKSSKRLGNGLVLRDNVHSEDNVHTDEVNVHNVEDNVHTENNNVHTDEDNIDTDDDHVINDEDNVHSGEDKVHTDEEYENWAQKHEVPKSKAISLLGADCNAPAAERAEINTYKDLNIISHTIGKHGDIVNSVEEHKAVEKGNLDFNKSICQNMSHGKPSLNEKYLNSNTSLSNKAKFRFTEESPRNEAGKHKLVEEEHQLVGNKKAKVLVTKVGQYSDGTTVYVMKDSYATNNNTQNDTEDSECKLELVNMSEGDCCDDDVDDGNEQETSGVAGNNGESDEMGNNRESDEMGSNGESDEMGNNRESDEMGNNREADEMRECMSSGTCTALHASDAYFVKNNNKRSETAAIQSGLLTKSKTETLHDTEVENHVKDSSEGNQQKSDQNEELVEINEHGGYSEKKNVSMEIPDSVTVEPTNKFLRNFKCGRCPKSFYMLSTLKHHMTLHKHFEDETTFNDYACNKCDKVCISKKKLLLHIRESHRTNTLHCNMCAKKFYRKCDLTRHEKEGHDMKEENGNATGDVIQVSCTKCESVFSSKDELRNHITTHKGDDLYKCKECLASFRYSSNLKRHIRARHEPDVVCPVEDCKKKYATEEGLHLHMRYHENFRPFQCSACLRSFTIKYQLISHQKKVHGFNMQPCQESSKPDNKCEVNNLCVKCGKVFKSHYQFALHWRNKVCEQVHKCPSCEKEFSSLPLLQEHSFKEHNTRVRPHKCQLCSKAFENKRNLKRHGMLAHSDGDKLRKDFMCSLCGLCFTAKDSLKRHLITHEGSRPYQCDRCPANFAQSGHLSRHIKTIHEKILNHVCDFIDCGKRFFDSASLRNHQRSHQTEYPYECEKCPKKFKFASSVKTHMKTHSFIKEFECKTCGQAVTSKKSLEKHMERHVASEKMNPNSALFDPNFHVKVRQKVVKKMEEKVITCQFCMKRFTTVRGVNAHIRKYCKGQNVEG